MKSASGTAAASGDLERRSSAGSLRVFFMRRVAPVLALAMIRLLHLTWRYREHGRERLERVRGSSRPLIGAFLHGRTFLLLGFMSRPRNGRWISMCSTSLDGDAMAKVEEALGFEVVRGSSGRDGLIAIVEMIRRVQEAPELGACLAVDGSRGPRGRVQGGILSLAQRTGGLVLPVTASARPAIIFRRAWDRTLLPLPFARVDVVYGEPLEVPQRPSREELVRLRSELEARMVALQAEADRAAGFGDDEPVVAGAGPDRGAVA